MNGFLGFSGVMCTYVPYHGFFCACQNNRFYMRLKISLNWKVAVKLSCTTSFALGVRNEISKQS